MALTQLIGTGIGFPEKSVSNLELEKFVDTNDEWIRTRTGIESRHIADPSKGETTASLAEKAARMAIEKAGIDPIEIDLVVMGTVTPDTVMPTVANVVQGRIGANRAFSFDLQAACSGWLYGLSIADSFIRDGKIKTALVIGGETLSTIVNWNDRSTCVLFGDGVGAAVVRRSDNDSKNAPGVLAIKCYADGRYPDLLSIPHGYAKVPPHSAEFRHDKNKVHMQGGEIFKHAVRCMVDSSRELLDSQSLTAKDVDYFIFHQANIRIIDMCLKTMGVERSKTWLNVHKYGNTSAATLPVCLHEAQEAGAIGPGKLVLMATFGGGLTWSSALIRL